jgi:hypothetical protein
MIRNTGTLDRFLRLAGAILAAEGGYFWLGSPWNWLAYAVAVILAATAALGFCPVYRLIGLAGGTGSRRPASPLRIGVMAVILLVLAVGGSYGSVFVTRKIFLEDFNAMNHFYKQALFLTGKNDRQQAIANFDQWKPAFATFKAKYSAYRPYALKGDTHLAEDFAAVDTIMATVEPVVRSGDLHEAHLELEKVRPIFQDLFKRNGFSLLAVALVDFHDAMETILAAANAKDAAQAIALYPAVSDKLKAVEAEENDAEIQDIRRMLDDLLAAAQAGETDALPVRADALRSSFIRVYLKSG